MPETQDFIFRPKGKVIHIENKTFAYTVYRFLSNVQTGGFHFTPFLHVEHQYYLFVLLFIFDKHLVKKKRATNIVL